MISKPPPEPSPRTLELRSALRGAKLFQNLDDAQIDSIAGRGRRLRLDRGQTLFLEGDSAQGLYVILSGRLKVYKTSSRGRHQILLLLGQGETVGEAAMFAGETFPASAEAVEASEVFGLPRNTFLEVIQAEPEVAMRLLSALSLRIRSFASMIEDLSLREVSERLAGHLVKLDSGCGSTGTIELDVTKAQLAATFGTAPETLSRAFQQLRKIGVIETSGRKIWVKDRQALDRAARGV
jgi:CRP/FNR family transcriptional regulator, dissimilatory nitrate respiration regulator